MRLQTLAAAALLGVATLPEIAQTVLYLVLAVVADSVQGIPFLQPLVSEWHCLAGLLTLVSFASTLEHK